MGFQLHYQIGLEHILSLDATDHIAFLIALCAIYSFKQWRAVLILVTAFTIGHTLTLGLSIFDILKVPTKLVETTLIPATILLTGLYNFTQNEQITARRFDYFLALFFGAIHGMAFANTLKASLLPGESLWKSLLGFNVGVEVAQIIIVAIILGLASLFLQAFKVPWLNWKNLISGIAVGMAIMMML